MHPRTLSHSHHQSLGRPTGVCPLTRILVCLLSSVCVCVLPQHLTILTQSLTGCEQRSATVCFHNRGGNHCPAEHYATRGIYWPSGGLSAVRPGLRRSTHRNESPHSTVAVFSGVTLPRLSGKCTLRQQAHHPTAYDLNPAHVLQYPSGSSVAAELMFHQVVRQLCLRYVQL